MRSWIIGALVAALSTNSSGNEPGTLRACPGDFGGYGSIIVDQRGGLDLPGSTDQFPSGRFFAVNRHGRYCIAASGSTVGTRYKTGIAGRQFRRSIYGLFEGEALERFKEECSQLQIDAPTWLITHTRRKGELKLRCTIDMPDSPTLKKFSDLVHELASDHGRTVTE